MRSYSTPARDALGVIAVFLSQFAGGMAATQTDTVAGPRCLEQLSVPKHRFTS
jgi:hypothetical protein